MFVEDVEKAKDVLPGTSRNLLCMAAVEETRRSVVAVSLEVRILGRRWSGEANNVK